MPEQVKIDTQTAVNNLKRLDSQINITIGNLDKLISKKYSARNVQAFALERQELSRLNDDMVKFSERMRAMTTAVEASVVKKTALVGTLGKVLKSFNAVGAIITVVSTAAELLYNNWDKIVGVFGKNEKISNGFNKLGKGTNEFISANNKASNSIANGHEKLMILTEQINLYKNAEKNGTATAEQKNKVLNDINSVSEKVGKRYTDINTAISEFNSIAPQYSKYIEDIAIAYAYAELAANDFVLSSNLTRTMNELRNSGQAGLSGLADTVEGFRGSLSIMESEYAEVTGEMIKNIIDGAEEGETSYQALERGLKKYVKRVREFQTTDEGKNWKPALFRLFDGTLYENTVKLDNAYSKLNEAGRATARNTKAQMADMSDGAIAYAMALNILTRSHAINTEGIREHIRAEFEFSQTTNNSTNNIKEFKQELQSLSQSGNLSQLQDFWLKIANDELQSLEIRKNAQQRYAELTTEATAMAYQEQHKALQKSLADGLIDIDNYTQSMNDLKTKIELTAQQQDLFNKKLAANIEISEARKGLESLDESLSQLSNNQASTDIQSKLENLRADLKKPFTLSNLFGFGEGAKQMEEQQRELDKMCEKIQILEEQEMKLKQVRDIASKGYAESILETGKASEDLTKKLSEASDEYADGAITRAEYEKKVQDAITDTGVKNEQDANYMAAEYIAANDEVLKKTKEVANARQEQSDKAKEHEIKNIEETKQKINAKLEEIKSAFVDTFSNMFSHMSEMIEINLDNQLKAMDKEQELADRRLDNMKKQNEARQMLGQTDEELAEATRKYIEEQMGIEDEAYFQKLTNDEMLQMLEHANEADREERELRKQQLEAEAERKKNDLEKKQATADYAMSLAQLTIDMVKFIGSFAAGTGPLGLSAPIVAAGLFGPLFGMLTANYAMKMSALNAKKFAQGGEVNKDMIAWVGDAYKHEYGVTKDGDVFKTPNKPTLTGLSEGTVIYKDLATFLSEYINPRVNDEITSFGNITYFGQFKEISTGLKKIERNTRYTPQMRRKYYEMI